MSQPATRTDFPYPVTEIENIWIPMPDGTRLAARIWLPENADVQPVPAILEYLPYRKRDGTVERDHLTHPYFAGHGYASVRVDMRGTGDSEGICRGEYLLQEQDDAIAVIEWLTEQPWCSGNVGIMGISWGGFNGLQVAARRPQALKAVITLCSTDDRYADDIHFMGGGILTDKLSWGATAFTIAMTPPDPAIVGDPWRDMWLQRLENNGCWLIDWFRHQRRGDFWKHGSICEDYSSITAAVYAIGGWADGYTNPVFRMMDKLSCPKKALIGPWAHKYPHFANPGPQIGFLQEALRWWDQHLKGIDTGIMDEPMIRAWVQDAHAPEATHSPRKGNWVTEESWDMTSPGKKWYLTNSSLCQSPPKDTPERILVASPHTAGRTAPNWFQFGLGADGPTDQNGEAGLVWSVESEPLDAQIKLLGFPRLRCTLSCERPVGQIGVVLSSVAPNGEATMISYGVLNLTHRQDHEHPSPMPEGKDEPIDVQLNACGQTVPKGYRLRLAISSAYWPILWPAPETAALDIDLNTARLFLPIRDHHDDQSTIRPFHHAEGAPPLKATPLTPADWHRRIISDIGTGVETFSRYDDTGEIRHEHTGLVVRYIKDEKFSIHPDDPNSANGVCTWSKSYSRGAWKAEVETQCKVEALKTVWRIGAVVIARENGQEIFRKEFNEDIIRDLV